MPRPARAAAVQVERRRRRDDTVDRVHARKLVLPAEFRDDPDYEYRWINDENDRVYSLTVEDDWDICTSSNPEASDDARVRRQVGTKKTGEALYAFLVRKPKEFYEEDRRKRTAAVSAAEQQMLTSPPTDNPSAAANSYVASGSSIRRGAYAP